MTTFNFSALSDGQSISFRPGVDVLRFDQSVISGADARIFASGGGTRIQVVSGQYAGKDVLLLNTTPYQLYTGNVTFASGTRLAVGDNSLNQNDDGSHALSGTAGRDVFYGFGGNDSMNGGDGNDVFVMVTGSAASLGNDSINGGNGFDVVDYSGARSSVSANLAAHTGSVLGDCGVAFLTGVDGVVGGAFNDNLRGNGAANRLEGGAGNDTLDSASGRDTLIGGSGNDSYIVFGGEVLSDASGTDTVISNANWTLGSGFENLMLGRPGTGIGNSASNVITGSSGEDTLKGNGANDKIYGGAGGDRIEGNSGNDLVIGGDEAFAEPWLDQVEARDMLDGGTGNDTVQGGNGNDGLIVSGDYGQDLLDGSAGEDMVFGGFHSGFFVDLAAGRVTGGGTNAASSATLVGIEDAHGGAFADRLFGNDAANLLIGAAESDSLNGRGGDDSLIGEQGRDTLTGGPGADQFFFWMSPAGGAPAADDAELITDFASGTDRFVLNLLGDFSGEFTAGDERFFAAPGAAAAHDATDRVIYDTSTGQLYYDADGVGGAPSVILATIQGAPHVAATDFTAW